MSNNYDVPDYVSRLRDPAPQREISAPAMEKMLKEQAEAQKQICEELKKEADDRTKSDKVYFVLGAVVSLVISLLVEYGAEWASSLTAALQQFLPW